MKASLFRVLQFSWCDQPYQPLLQNCRCLRCESQTRIQHWEGGFFICTGNHDYNHYQMMKITITRKIMWMKNTGIFLWMRITWAILSAATASQSRGSLSRIPHCRLRPPLNSILCIFVFLCIFIFAFLYVCIFVFLYFCTPVIFSCCIFY